MSFRKLISIGAICLLAISWAQASPTKITSQTIEVDIGGVDTAIPFEIYGETDLSGQELKLTGQADLANAMQALNIAMERLVDERHRGCRERWDGWAGSSEIEGGTLSLAVTVRVEKWVCERVFGEEVSTRLARETGRINAALKPSIRDGRLHVEIERFHIDDLSSLSREFGVETLLREALQREIDSFNTDDEKSLLPPNLTDIGFRYDSINLSSGDTAFAEVSIVGPNNLEAVIKAITSRKSE